MEIYYWAGVFVHSLISDCIRYDWSWYFIALSCSLFLWFLLWEVHGVVPGVSLSGKLRFLEFEFHWFVIRCVWGRPDKIKGKVRSMRDVTYNDSWLLRLLMTWELHISKLYIKGLWVFWIILNYTLFLNKIRQEPMGSWIRSISVQWLFYELSCLVKEVLLFN